MGRPRYYASSWSPDLRNLHRSRVVHRQICSCCVPLASRWPSLCRHIHVYVGGHLQSFYGLKGRKRSGPICKAAVQKINVKSLLVLPQLESLISYPA